MNRLHPTTYLIIARYDGAIVRHIAAFSACSAWAKFCRLYFGALKPSRKDYTVNTDG